MGQIARSVNRSRVRGRAHRRAGERGAVAVEFGLIAPLLILLVFGIIDFGWMFNRNTIVRQRGQGRRTRGEPGRQLRAGSEHDYPSELASYGIPTRRR